MKYTLLLTCTLYWPLAAYAQDSTAIRISYASALPSSQQYGWFQRQSWAMDRVLGRPGWKIQNSGTSQDGWDYILFMANDTQSAVAYRLWRGSIGGVTYSFAQSNPEGREWRTAGFERVGENEWVDRPNNARIKRRYSGDIVSFQVSYEPFTK